jgi:pimeloyl-ACP methyl ester carboxylesterase
MKKNVLAFLFILLIIESTHAQKRNYVLVHGAWHGAWCWNKVIPLLKRHQHNVIGPDLPGHGQSKKDPSTVTFDDYVDTVVEAARSMNGRVILVGHSMAGVIIAQAAERLGTEKVERLIFLDAFMPLNGESVFSLAEKTGRLNAEKNISAESPTVNESLILSPDQKTGKLKSENVAKLFYHDCSSQDIAYAQANLCAQPMACLAAPVHVSDQVYGAIAKTYILCTNAKDLDKSSISVNVPCEKVIKLESSHSPFLAMPEKLADVLMSL